MYLEDAEEHGPGVEIDVAVDLVPGLMGPHHGPPLGCGSTSECMSGRPSEPRSLSDQTCPVTANRAFILNGASMPQAREASDPTFTSAESHFDFRPRFVQLGSECVELGHIGTGIEIDTDAAKLGVLDGQALPRPHMALGLATVCGRERRPAGTPRVTTHRRGTGSSLTSACASSIALTAPRF